jgi:hypothetical protein
MSTAPDKGDGAALLLDELRDEARMLIALIDEVKRLKHVADDGESAATPLILLTGIGVAPTVVVVVTSALALVLYNRLDTGGRSSARSASPSTARTSAWRPRDEATQEMDLGAIVRTIEAPTPGDECPFGMGSAATLLLGAARADVGSQSGSSGDARAVGGDVLVSADGSVTSRPRGPASCIDRRIARPG